MAKYETMLQGDLNALLDMLHDTIIRGSMSASYEDGSNFSANSIRVATRVYERYSVFGSNRVSMNVTLVGFDNSIFASIITSGGSQAMLYKINTIGEETFLDEAVKAIDRFRNSR